MQIVVYAALTLIYFLVDEFDTFIAPGIASVIHWGVVLAGLFFSLFNIIPTYSVSARRFHDLGHTGWLVLFFVVAHLITGVAIFAQLIWFAVKGADGSSEYGPDPLGHDAEVFE